MDFFFPFFNQGDSDYGPTSSEEETSGSEYVTSLSSVSHISGIDSDRDSDAESDYSESNISNASTGSWDYIFRFLVPPQHIPGYRMSDFSKPDPPNKRARLSLTDCDNGEDDEDDGITCPLCQEKCEMLGSHRLTSLNCGHIFGATCLREWFEKCGRAPYPISCPRCNSLVLPKGIRYLYAKRLRALDKSEIKRMSDQLAEERVKANILQFQLETVKKSCDKVKQKLQMLEAENKALKNMLNNEASNYSDDISRNACVGGSVAIRTSMTYKLFLDKIEFISRSPSSRIITYSDQHSKLLVSKKGHMSSGYGFQIYDITAFKYINYMETCYKIVSDTSLSYDQKLIAVTSKQRSSTLFDMQDSTRVARFEPAKVPIWSCAIGHKDENENCLYLGAEQGSIYVYDIRNSEKFLEENKTEGDSSTVIQIESIPKSEIFPCGGLLVCKMNSLWFYENMAGEGYANSTRLNVEGNLMSMTYNNENQTLLLQTSSCLKHPHARHILGKLNKIDSIPLFEIKATVYVSTNSPVMVRSTQIAVDSLPVPFIQMTLLIWQL